MSGIDDVQALFQLTADKFREFCSKWGGAKDTVETCVQSLAYRGEKRQWWERTIIYHLGRLGAVGLKTEDEKLLDLTTLSSDAARDSAV